MISSTAFALFLLLLQATYALPQGSSDGSQWTTTSAPPSSTTSVSSSSTTIIDSTTSSNTTSVTSTTTTTSITSTTTFDSSTTTSVPPSSASSSTTSTDSITSSSSQSSSTTPCPTTSSTSAPEPPPTSSPCPSSTTDSNPPPTTSPSGTSPSIPTPTPLRATFDTTFDNKEGSLNNVACSNGDNGLAARFQTLADLPSFPYIGGVFDVAWNSPNCGACWSITYPATGVTINVTAVDTAGAGFNLAKEAYDVLTGGSPVTVDVLATKVVPSVCGL